MKAVSSVALLKGRQIFGQITVRWTRSSCRSPKPSLISKSRNVVRVRGTCTHLAAHPEYGRPIVSEALVRMHFLDQDNLLFFINEPALMRRLEQVLPVRHRRL